MGSALGERRVDGMGRDRRGGTEGEKSIMEHTVKPPLKKPLAPGVLRREAEIIPPAACV
jgi:hypothetical protein